MNPSRNAHVMMFRHPDGRWIEAILLGGFHQLGTYENPGGGVYVGADPSNDIVLDDDGVEDFHAHYFAAGHHQYVAVIAGEVMVGFDPPAGIHTPKHGHALEIGDLYRGPWRVRGWGFGRFDDNVPNFAAIHTAMSIANDARAEGRHDAAAAILGEVGYRRLELAPRSRPPERLFQSEQLLRIRVEIAGRSNVHALGSMDRLSHGVTIGDLIDCDLQIPAAGGNRVRLVRASDLLFEVQRGSITVNRVERPAGTSHRAYNKYERFQLGDAIVQICRWPRRGEPVL